MAECENGVAGAEIDVATLGSLRHGKLGDLPLRFLEEPQRRTLARLMTPLTLTPHQSQYVAWLLTRRTVGDTVESFASTLVDPQVDLNPHQVDAALFACSNPLSCGVILADEVGLGKTIEAGLVITQRWAERRRRILIIVPANARTLIEQSIGRGLRLPYGKRTGVAAVDRLNIVAHDKFQEIIDEANRGDSPIRLKHLILDAPSAEDKKVSVQVESAVSTRLGLADTSATTSSSSGGDAAPAPVFTTEAEKRAARVVMDVIGKYEVKPDLVPTSNALLRPEVQKEILAEVTERLKPMQGSLQVDTDESVPALDLSAILAKTTDIVVKQTIDIPRIAVVPNRRRQTVEVPVDPPRRNSREQVAAGLSAV